MTKTEFIGNIHRRIAIISVGGSAIRNQGASGLIDIAREYFEKEISLDDFFSCLKDKEKFKQFLDGHTNNLVKKFPLKGKSWGAARKALNLFLRDLTYNKFIAEKYNLAADFYTFNQQIKNLEVPLDSYVAKHLYKNSEEELPKWTSIKELKPEISKLYQKQALMDAKSQKIARVHLDLIYWRES